MSDSAAASPVRTGCAPSALPATVRGGGSGGRLTLLREMHPIPEFDDHVTFYDSVVVDADDKPTDLPVDQPPPPGHRLLGHKYFVDGVMMAGSMTGVVHSFFEEFDVEAHSTRIAESNRIVSDPSYAKYYLVGWPQLEEDWPIRVATCMHESGITLEESPRRYVEAGGSYLPTYRLFRTIYSDVAKAVIVQEWTDKKERAATLGTAFHLAAEMYWNDMYDADDERFKTKEFGHFLEYVETWVRPRRLLPYRTELCMSHRNLDGDGNDEGGDRVCGMIDMVFVHEDHLRDSGGRVTDVVLVDWKRSERIDSAAFREEDVGRPPLHRMPNCNLSHYQCQLNGYKYVLEANTRYRVTSMHIVVCHPDNSGPLIFDVPELQSEMRVCFDTVRLRSLAAELAHYVGATADKEAETEAECDKMVALAERVNQLQKKVKRGNVPRCFRQFIL